MIQKLTISMHAAERTNVLDERFYYEVPSQVKGMKIELSKTIDHYLTMAVYDPLGRLRGQFLYGGRNELVIHEDEKYSTPYTISGEIPEGSWYCSVVGEGEWVDSEIEWGKIQITFNPSELDTFNDDVYVDTGSYPYLSGFDETKVWHTEERWYKGDLHTHTIFSDGEMSREELVKAAKKEGLDFIVNTDHSVLTTKWPKSSDLLVIPGTELSFYHGHANIINPKEVAFQNGDVNVIASHEGAVEALNVDYGVNALIMINHPVQDQFTWQYGKIPLHRISAIEIINSPTYHLAKPSNDWALEFWDYLLNDGHQITGVGGSDVHGALGNTLGERVGDPATYIYSQELSAKAIVKGIKSKQVVVSRTAFILKTFKTYKPGDNIQENSGTVNVTIDTEEAIYIEWVIDGEVVKREEGTESQYTFNWDDRYHWIRVNVRSKHDNSLFGFTNPYFYGEKESTLTHWQDGIDYIREKYPEIAEFFKEG